MEALPLQSLRPLRALRLARANMDLSWDPRLCKAQAMNLGAPRRDSYFLTHNFLQIFLKFLLDALFRPF